MHLIIYGTDMKEEMYIFTRLNAFKVQNWNMFYSSGQLLSFLILFQRSSSIFTHLIKKIK